MSRSFTDGCHKYGWVITIVVTILIQLIAAAYMNGQQSQKVMDLKEFFGNRIDRLERQVDELIQRP